VCVCEGGRGGRGGRLRLSAIIISPLSSAYDGGAVNIHGR